MLRAVSLIAVLIAAACGGGASPGDRSGATLPVATRTPGGIATATPSTPSPAPGGGAATATVELEKGGSFTIQLRPEKAPQTVARFVSKATSGFYNGLTFHRVEDWVVQGGDPTGTGRGGQQVAGEYNDLPFTLGAVGIARGPDRDFMNDSQWFVVKRDSTFLDRDYANFGMVTSGMDVVLGIRVGDRIKAIRIS